MKKIRKYKGKLNFKFNQRSVIGIEIFAILFTKTGCSITPSRRCFFD